MSLGTLNSIAQVLSTAPTHSQVNTHHQAIPHLPELLVEPEEHWKFGSRARNSAQRWPQPPPLQCRESTISIKETTSRKLWGRSSQECQEQFGLAPGKPPPTFPPRAPVLATSESARVSWPSSQLPVKPEAETDIQEEGQNANNQSTGTSLPVSIMAHKHSPGHTRVFVEQKHIQRVCLKRKYSTTDFEQ